MENFQNSSDWKMEKEEWNIQEDGKLHMIATCNNPQSDSLKALGQWTKCAYIQPQVPYQT